MMRRLAWLSASSVKAPLVKYGQHKSMGYYLLPPPDQAARTRAFPTFPRLKSIHGNLYGSEATKEMVAAAACRWTL